MGSKKCEKCYKYADDEHVIVPIRDLSFLTLNLRMAFDILDPDIIEISEQEKETMDKLFETYAPIIHYWSVGRFYDMTDEEMEKFEYTHESYM